MPASLLYTYIDSRTSECAGSKSATAAIWRPAPCTATGCPHQRENTRPQLPGVENRRHLFEPLAPAVARGGVCDQVALIINVQGSRRAPYCHRSVCELNNEIGLVVFTYLLEPSQLAPNRHRRNSRINDFY